MVALMRDLPLTRKSGLAVPGILFVVLMIVLPGPGPRGLSPEACYFPGRMF
jgi:hypothetical protein